MTGIIARTLTAVTPKLGSANGLRLQPQSNMAERGVVSARG